jgi:uncharacterized protein YbjT (DUF2867 family)
MRVLVTGAYGLIGSAVAARLSREHEVVAGGRDAGKASRYSAAARSVAADFNRLTTADAWRPILQDIDAVVNCVGVLQDGLRDNAHRVHVEATAALFAACEQAGIRRVVHISAIGAEQGGPTAFSRGKAEAEQDLAARDLDWAILRPALVLAGAVYGGSAMLRAVAAFPGVTPLIAADAKIQIVSVEDVAETVARCLAPGVPARVTWDIAHPKVHALADIVTAIRRWLGFAPRPVVRVPHLLARAIGVCADALGLLGWRSPARTTALKQLEAGVVGDPAAWIAATGITPMSLDDILARRPASVQDRWFARLYLLKPVAIFGLALFWFVTGALALGPGRASAVAQMTATGTAPDIAYQTVIWGAWFDIAMGLLLCVRRFARATLILMIVATFGYLAAGTWLAPQLWIDPLGPLTKISPMLVATALTLAIIDER